MSNQSNQSQRREVIKASAEHEAEFRATFELRADLASEPYWQAGYEYAATHKLYPDEMHALGGALVRKRDSKKSPTQPEAKPSDADLYKVSYDRIHAALVDNYRRWLSDSAGRKMTEEVFAGVAINELCPILDRELAAHRTAAVEAATKELRAQAVKDSKAIGTLNQLNGNWETHCIGLEAKLAACQKERDDLKRDFDQMVKAHGEENARLSEMTIERDELKTAAAYAALTVLPKDRLAELERDKARLDWMYDHWNIGVENAFANNGGKIREAIDAAMQAGKSEGKAP